MGRFGFAFVAMVGAAGCTCALAGAAALPRWSSVGPPGGAGAISTDPADAKHVIVLGAAGDFFETRDRGATWTQGTASCASNESVIIRDAAYYQICTDGIWQTLDDGRDWQPLKPVQSNPNGWQGFRQLVFEPSDASQALVVGTLGTLSTALLASHDAGVHWDQKTAVPLPATPTLFAFDPSQPGRLVTIASTSKFTDPVSRASAWESRDMGDTWRQLGETYAWPTQQPCGVSHIAADSAGGLYLLTGCGLQASHDGGITWSFTSTADLGSAPGEGLGFGADLRVDPSVPGHALALGESTMVETHDGGATWSKVSRPADAYALVEFGRDGAAWAASFYGVFRREPGAQAWTQVPVEGLRYGAQFQIAIGGTRGEVLVEGGTRSADGGQHWMPMPVHFPIAVAGQPRAFYAPDPSAGPPLWTSYAFSSDAGATWQPANMVLTAPSGDPIDNLAPVGPQPGVIYATSMRPGDCIGGLCLYDPVAVVRSDDGGKTWRSIDAGLSGRTRSVAVTAADPAVVYVSSGGIVYRSADAGAHWTALTGLKGTLVPDAVDRSTAYQWGAGISYTVDGGAHWTAGSFPNVRGQYWFLADPQQAGRAYLVSYDGTIFETRDRGLTWRQAAVGAALRFHDYPPVIATDGADRIIAGTDGLGVYSIRLSGDPLIVDTDLWWDPAQSGWGISVAQHQSGNMFVVWYRYDAQGMPTWSVVPGGTWTDARTFTGTLYDATYAPTGPPLQKGGAFDPAQVHMTAIGKATLAFADANTADVAFAMDDGTRFDHHVVRQLYGPPTPFSITNIGDLWWNPQQSGWGLGLHQQYGTVFATWFVYDADGHPTWLVIPSLQLGNGLYFGDLYAMTGPPSTGPFDPSKVVATKLGNVSLVSNVRGFTMLFPTTFGHTSSVVISRQPF